MNKFIKEQLDSLKSTDIEQISDTEFLLKKKVSIDSVSVNHYYLIELADYIIHPSDNFNLASNWNKGIVPSSKTMKAMVTQTLGKMIKVDAVGESEDVYTGLWLPMGGVKVVKEL